TLAAVGFADTWWATMRNSIFQLQADEAYRGRTLSAFLLVGRGMAQTSQLQTGLAVEAFGPAVAATAGAALIAVAIVGVNARDDEVRRLDRKSTRLNSSHEWISYAVFCLKKKKIN